MFDAPFDFFALAIAIVAFIFARKAMNQAAALSARLDAIEATAAAARPVPPPLPPREELAPGPAVAPPPSQSPWPRSRPNSRRSRAQLPARPPPPAASAAAGSAWFRGAAGHPLGGLDRRPDAGARRLLHGALLDRGRPDRPRRAHLARRPVRAGAASGRRMDAPQGEHLRDRGATDRQYPRDPHRGRHGGGVRHRLCGLRALWLSRARHRLHPARHGRARHAGGGAAARAGAGRPRRRRRLRDACSRFLREAGFLGALHLSRDRHRGVVRPGAHPAVALACGHHHRVRVAVDVPLPAMRPRDDRPARLPCHRGLRAREPARRLRLAVRSAGRWRAGRTGLLRLARGLSVRRHPDRAERFSCRRRHDHLCIAGRGNVCSSPGRRLRPPARSAPPRCSLSSSSPSGRCAAIPTCWWCPADRCRGSVRTRPTARSRCT